MYVVEHPVWIALASCAAALAFAAIGIVRVVRASNDLARHLNRLANAPLISDLASFEQQSQRLQAVAPRVNDLVARARSAASSVRASARTTGLPEAIAEVRQAF